MAKDYARKRRSRSQQRQSASGWMWLTAGFCLALLIVGLYYLHGYHQQQKTLVQKKSKAPQTVRQNSQLQFDFYTMLPGKPSPSPATAPGQKAAQRPAQQLPAPSLRSPATNQQYILQIAAVKDHAAADQLKAKLTLLGFNVFIQKYKVSNTVWSRVNVGPYATRNLAEIDQKRLRRNNINSLLLKK